MSHLAVMLEENNNAPCVQTERNMSARGPGSWQLACGFYHLFLRKKRNKSFHLSLSFVSRNVIDLSPPLSTLEATREGFPDNDRGHYKPEGWSDDFRQTLCGVQSHL